MSEPPLWKLNDSKEIAKKRIPLPMPLVFVEGELASSENSEQFLPRPIRGFAIQALIGVLPDQRSLEGVTVLGS